MFLYLRSLISVCKTWKLLSSRWSELGANFFTGDECWLDTEIVSDMRASRLNLMWYILIIQSTNDLILYFKVASWFLRWLISASWLIHFVCNSWQADTTLIWSFLKSAICCAWSFSDKKWTSSNSYSNRTMIIIQY